MKKFLPLCLAVTMTLTASAQHSWKRYLKAEEPSVYIISVKEPDMSAKGGEMADAKALAHQRSLDAKAAIADHRKANRTGFQSVAEPSAIFTTNHNRASFAVGGFVAMRASYSFDNAVGNIDMVPYDVPIATSFASRQALGMDATTSRLYMRAIFNPKHCNHPIVIYFDTDFRGGAEGSYTPRLRSGYVSIAGLTFGRDVTTFCDLNAAPTTIDFQGPNAYNYNFSTVIRYEIPFLDNHMKAGVAAELPDVSGSYGESFTAVPQRVPDFPLYLQYMWGKNRQSHIRASAVLRNMYLYNDIRESSTDLFGWGVQFSGNIHVTKMLQFFMNGVYGEGITPYIQDLTGSGLDFTPNPLDASRIQTMPMWGFQAAAQLNIIPNLFVSGGYSMVQIQHKNGYYAEDQYRRGQYAFGNVFYCFSNRFHIAGEYLWAYRKNMNGEHNHANRINLLFKYNF